MTWNKQDFRQIVWITVGLWLLILAAYAAGELIAGRLRFLSDLPVDIVAVLIVAALVLPAYPLILRLADRTSVQRWAYLAFAVFVISLAQSVVNMFENRLLGVIPAFSAEHVDLIRERFSRNFQNHLYVTFANVALIAFIVQVRHSADARIALAEARAAVDRERLAALRLQLNPHFLFNTLNSISSLVIAGRTGDADQMIDSLCDFLRSSLETGDDLLVSLDDELAMIDAYLEMQMIRFGERLQVEVHIDQALRKTLRLPGFLLQPLVENAIKYAVAPVRRPVTLTILGHADNDTATIAIMDDGPGKVDKTRSEQAGMGIGITNTRERLAMQYGSDARLETGERPEGGWSSRVILPLPRKPAGEIRHSHTSRDPHPTPRGVAHGSAQWA